MMRRPLKSGKTLVFNRCSRNVADPYVTALLFALRFLRIFIINRSSSRWLRFRLSRYDLSFLSSELGPEQREQLETAPRQDRLKQLASWLNKPSDFALERLA